MSDRHLPLCDLPARVSASITHLPIPTDNERCIARRLMELGFSEGMAIEVLHRAPLGGDPIAVQVGATTIALRVAEARQILVRPS